MAVTTRPEQALGYRAIVFTFAVLAAALAYFLIANRPQARPEAAAADVLARAATRPVRPDIVILALDDAGVKKYGPVKTWPRSLLAQGISRAEAGGAKLVVVDLKLDQRTKTGDEALWKMMANRRNVVLGMSYDATRDANHLTADDIRGLVFLEQFAIADNLTLDAQRTQQFPYYFFEPPVSDFTQSAAGVGVFDRETDTDGVLRNARLIYTSKVEYPAAVTPIRGKFPTSNLADGVPVALPNLALVAALRAFNLDKTSVHVVAGSNVHLTGQISPPVDVPVDEQGRMLIRYSGPAGTYPVVSFADVASGKIKPDFHNKIVLVGATATGDDATDLTVTPFPTQMPRVEVTANALATLLDRSYVEVVSRHAPHLLGTLLIVGLLVGLCLMFVSGARSAIVALLLLVVYAAACWAFFAFGHLLLPILPGFLIILLTFLVSLALFLGPFRPVTVAVSPTYVPPPADSVHDQS
ncbi:MAG: CHASE2 domain-containing protein [Armatimonadota bacterium]|nr:CHASE2 domain-containing protein [Armatimonadota bacterium]